MKKIVSILLCILLLTGSISCLSLPTLAEETKHNSGIYTYKVINDDATITKIKKKVKGDIVIPKVIDGYKITCIGKNAFRYRSKITSVTIPDSVKEIKNRAFMFCRELKTVNIPKSVEKIGKDVFKYSHKIRNFNVDKNNSFYCDIDGVLFTKDKTTLIKFPAKKQINSYKIPKGTKSIETLAFDGCRLLNSVTITNSVEKIGNWAFNDCANLSKIKISKNLTNIGINVFSNTKYYNKKSNWENKVLYLDNYLISTDDIKESCKIKKGTKLIADRAFYYTSLTKVTIPEGVKIIGKSAFESCNNLVNVTLPKSLTTIGDCAFYYCDLLTITIPKNVSSIGNNVFNYCEYLYEVKVDKANKFFCDVDGVLFNKQVTELIYYPKYKTAEVYEIPSSITTIPKHAFERRTNLTTVTIPDSVTKIEQNAFASCTALTSVTLSKNITRIASGTFYGCTSLKSIVIPENVTKIEKSAFSNCKSLTSVTLLNKQTKIKDGAFENCNNLSNNTN